MSDYIYNHDKWQPKPNDRVLACGTLGGKRGWYVVTRDDRAYLTVPGKWIVANVTHFKLLDILPEDPNAKCEIKAPLLSPRAPKSQAIEVATAAKK